MPFGNRLKECREKNKLTQEQVAAFFGEDFSRQSVSKWEREECFPEVEKLLILATKLDVSLDDLFKDELSYLRGDKDASDFEEKYPGIIVGLKVFMEHLTKLER